MRWPVPSYGDTKIVTKFMWLPISAGNETRWLETATILYHYTGIIWTPIKFLDKEE